MKRILAIFSAAAMVAALSAACSTRSAVEAEAVNAVEVDKVEKPAVTMAPVATDGKVIELSDPSLIAPGVNVSQLTVVDFNAVWCGPCRQLAPVLEEMAAKYKGKATFISVDVDKYGDLFEAYRLGNAIPAVLFIKPDGKMLRFIGTDQLLPASSFEALIDANL